MAWGIRIRWAAVLLAIAGMSGQAMAADALNGKSLYLNGPVSGGASCASCHGASPASNVNGILAAANQPAAGLRCPFARLPQEGQRDPPSGVDEEDDQEDDKDGGEQLHHFTFRWSLISRSRSRLLRAWGRRWSWASRAASASVRARLAPGIARAGQRAFTRPPSRQGRSSPCVLLRWRVGSTSATPCSPRRCSGANRLERGRNG